MMRRVGIIFASNVVSSRFPLNMAPDSRHDGVSSKRKSHDGPEDTKPRKKQHRHVSASNDFQFEAYGSGEDKIASKPSNKFRGKSAPRIEKGYSSVNELKRRIRDVKRLLNKKDLPADVRVLQERALAGYEQDLEEELARRERSQMIKKYHFVRFLGVLLELVYEFRQL